MPPEAVAAHIRLLALPLLALALLRVVVSLYRESAAARWVSALAASAALAVMACYYALVLIGLESWGRVVSWDLIRTYGAQAGALADTLEISLALAVGVLALGYFALLAGTFAYLRRFDWSPAITRSLRPGLLALLVCAGGAVAAAEAYRFLSYPPVREFEPVSLTFYPQDAGSNLQGHVVDRLTAARLDALEGAARRRYLPAPSAGRKNVVLIVVDALRADHMGVYGYMRDTTPRLAQLENAGVLRKASAVRASCGSSLCGLLSMAAARSLHDFSARPITLQEALKRHGYRVHLLLSGDHTSFYGLREIYGEVDRYFDARTTTRALRHMNDDRFVLEHLSGYPAWDGKPVMFQFHLMATHVLGWRDPAAARFTPAANYALHRDPGPGGARSERAVNFYDNGVVQADATIGRILDTLERKGYLKDALVVITADHGEALGEHGLFQHANSVREEALRIPLVLVSYGFRAQHPLAEHLLASQIDIAPTILTELGMPLPASWKGVPLQHPAARDFLHFQEQFEIGLYDLRDPRNLWKYWLDLKTDREYAFNLTLDSLERGNAIASVPQPLKREWRLRVLGRGPLSAKARSKLDGDLGGL